MDEFIVELSIQETRSTSFIIKAENEKDLIAFLKEPKNYNHIKESLVFLTDNTELFIDGIDTVGQGCIVARTTTSKSESGPIQDRLDQQVAFRRKNEHH